MTKSREQVKSFHFEASLLFYFFFVCVLLVASFGLAFSHFVCACVWAFVEMLKVLFWFFISFYFFWLGQVFPFRLTCSLMHALIEFVLLYFVTYGHVCVLMLWWGRLTVMCRYLAWIFLFTSYVEFFRSLLLCLPNVGLQRIRLEIRFARVERKTYRNALLHTDERANTFLWCGVQEARKRN